MRTTRRQGSEAQLPLPGEEVGAVGVIIVVGVTIAVLAEVALPPGKIGSVDVAVVVEIGADM